jgi:hypothetical protein
MYSAGFTQRCFYSLHVFHFFESFSIVNEERRNNKRNQKSLYRECSCLCMTIRYSGKEGRKSGKTTGNETEENLMWEKLFPIVGWESFVFLVIRRLRNNFVALGKIVKHVMEKNGEMWTILWAEFENKFRILRDFWHKIWDFKFFVTFLKKFLRNILNCFS